MLQLISKKGRFEAWRLEPLPGNEQQQQGGQGQAGQSMDDVQSSGEDWASSLGGQAMAKFARSQRNTARRRVEVQPDTQDLYLNQRGSLVFTGTALVCALCAQLSAAMPAAECASGKIARRTARRCRGRRMQHWCSQPAVGIRADARWLGPAGSLHSRGSASTIFLDLETGQVPQRRLAGCEGLVIRVSCDSTPFLLQLFTGAQLAPLGSVCSRQTSVLQLPLAPCTAEPARRLHRG